MTVDGDAAQPAYADLEQMLFAITPAMRRAMQRAGVRGGFNLEDGHWRLILKSALGNVYIYDSAHRIGSKKAFSAGRRLFPNCAAYIVPIVPQQMPLDVDCGPWALATARRIAQRLENAPDGAASKYIESVLQAPYRTH